MLGRLLTLPARRRLQRAEKLAELAAVIVFDAIADDFERAASAAATPDSEFLATLKASVATNFLFGKPQAPDYAKHVDVPRVQIEALTWLRYRSAYKRLAVETLRRLEETSTALGAVSRAEQAAALRAFGGEFPEPLGPAGYAALIEDVLISVSPGADGHARELWSELSHKL